MHHSKVSPYKDDVISRINRIENFSLPGDDKLKQVVENLSTFK
jgi:hypothetical protein